MAYKPAATRTGIFPFELCNQADGPWTNQPWHYRREFYFTMPVKRWRVHVRNRGQLADANGGQLTNLKIGVGLPVIGTDGKWNGQISSPTGILTTATTVASGSEGVSPWMSTSSWCQPFTRYVVTYEFTTPASGGTAYGGGVGFQTFTLGDYITANPSGLARSFNSGMLQVWIEYQFVDDSAPVMLVVGNSLSNGTTAGYDSMGELTSWPQIWASAQRGSAASIAVAGSFASHYKAANAGQRWNVYDTCAIPLDPDLILYYGVNSSDAGSEGGATTTTKADTVLAIQMGRTKFPNARVVITDIPPRIDFTGDGTANGTLEKARLDINAWMHMLPAQAELCLDTQVISDWANPARMRAPYNGDNVHMSPMGHALIGQLIPGFGRRNRS